ncbi:MAG: histidinol-phosphate transaminase [Dehalococcoidia bacterium]|nr:histidinol-phosphate transaminase [Dehalococcoidia bacterium]
MNAVFHGGVQPEELRALGLDPSSVVDLSANLHPAGPDARVLAAARTAALDRYPPADAGPLREAIARSSGLDPACVLVTPGATAAIHLIARACLREGDHCAILGPTFGEYAAAARAAGASPIEVRAMPPAFNPPIEDERIESAALTVLCNPNNPTGRYLGRTEVGRLAARSRLLLLDVAYADFVSDAWDADALVPEYPVAVVHSMTKLHAIPGLRLGYIVAAPEIIARVAPLQPSWSIDAASHAAGLVAVDQRETRQAALAALPRTRDRIRAACEEAGWGVVPGQANFLLVHSGDGAATRLALLQAGFAVRDCASFGLPEWVRIAVPAGAHADALIAAITRVAEVRA